MHQKSYKQNKLEEHEWKWRKCMFLPRFANNFILCIFKELFQWIRNQREILRFLYPYWIF